MTVWQANIDDVGDLVEMAERFHEAGDRNCAFRGEDMAGAFRTLIEGGGVFRSEKGFIAGAVVSEPFNADYRIAMELYWWSEDNEGKALRDAFEQWGRESGCDAVAISFERDAVGRLLRRSGYVHTSRMMQKCA